MDFHQLHAAPGRIFSLDSLLQRSNFYPPDFLAERPGLSFKQPYRMTYGVSSTAGDGKFIGALKRRGLLCLFDILLIFVKPHLIGLRTIFG